MLFKHIDMVGVELEGSWDSMTAIAGFHGDGSVNTVGYQTGEVASPGLLPKDLYRWIDDPVNYPTYVNSSCGFHTHISTKTNGDYVALMHKDFWSAFTSEMSRFLRNILIEFPSESVASIQFSQRLAGLNDYCKKEFIPMKQYFHKSKSYERYTQLNYCAGVHKTLECRLFPMFDSRKAAVACVKNYVEFVELWLRENGHKLSGKVSINTPFDQQVERIIISGSANVAA